MLGEEARHALEREEGDLEGMVVDVEITDYPTAMRPARGRVIEVLGEQDAFGVDVEIMIRKHHLPHAFPADVLEEARAVAHLDAEEIAQRRDFRDLPIVTIDGETAKDFDDAVLVTERNDGGYELQVHIADVSEYVRPGTDLDLEAKGLELQPLFEHGLVLTLRGSDGSAISEKPLTATEGVFRPDFSGYASPGRWSGSMPVPAASHGARAMLEAWSSSAKDGSLECLVQTPVRVGP